jgi:hypothetical protein
LLLVAINFGCKNSFSQAITFDSVINIILDFSSHLSKQTSCVDWFMYVIVPSAQSTFEFKIEQANLRKSIFGKVFAKVHHLPMHDKFSSVVPCWLRFQEQISRKFQIAHPATRNHQNKGLTDKDYV